MKPEFESAAEVLHGDAEVSFLFGFLAVPTEGPLALRVTVVFHKPQSGSPCPWRCAVAPSNNYIILMVRHGQE
jgi:hypothetical protein